MVSSYIRNRLDSDKNSRDSTSGGIMIVPAWAFETLTFRSISGVYRKADFSCSRKAIILSHSQRTTPAHGYSATRCSLIQRRDFHLGTYQFSRF